MERRTDRTSHLLLSAGFTAAQVRQMANYGSATPAGPAYVVRVYQQNCPGSDPCFRDMRGEITPYIKDAAIYSSEAAARSSIKWLTGDNVVNMRTGISTGYLAEAEIRRQSGVRLPSEAAPAPKPNAPRSYTSALDRIATDPKRSRVGAAYDAEPKEPGHFTDPGLIRNRPKRSRIGAAYNAIVERLSGRQRKRRASALQAEALRERERSAHMRDGKVIGTLDTTTRSNHLTPRRGFVVMVLGEDGCKIKDSEGRARRVCFVKKFATTKDDQDELVAFAQRAKVFATEEEAISHTTWFSRWNNRKVVSYGDAIARASSAANEDWQRKLRGSGKSTFWNNPACAEINETLRYIPGQDPPDVQEAKRKLRAKCARIAHKLSGDKRAQEMDKMWDEVSEKLLISRSPKKASHKIRGEPCAQINQTLRYTPSDPPDVEGAKRELRKKCARIAHRKGRVTEREMDEMWDEVSEKLLI